MLKFLCAVAVVVLLPMDGIAANLTGRVVAVHDGDTLTLLVDRQQIRVRLAEIDAPERKQAFGNRSKEALTELCHGKVAQVEEGGKDRYGRVIGQVTCAGLDANAEQVRHGMAWVYNRYAQKESSLYFLQENARISERGLWADRDPISPWQWRRSLQ